jgi:hypothetical protein
VPGSSAAPLASNGSCRDVHRYRTRLGSARRCRRQVQAASDHAADLPAPSPLRVARSALTVASLLLVVGTVFQVRPHGGQAGALVRNRLCHVVDLLPRVVYSAWHGDLATTATLPITLSVILLTTLESDHAQVLLLFLRLHSAFRH